MAEPCTRYSMCCSSSIVRSLRIVTSETFISEESVATDTAFCPGKVIAEIDVNTDLRIPKGSTAELAAEMLGGVKMNLLLANNPREKYQIGDTIPGTLNNGMMEKVAAMMPQLEKMLPKLDSILGSLNMVLADPAIPTTLHNVQTLTANLAVTSGQLQTLVRRFADSGFCCFADSVEPCADELLFSICHALYGGCVWSGCLAEEGNAAISESNWGVVDGRYFGSLHKSIQLISYV